MFFHLLSTFPRPADLNRPTVLVSITRRSGAPRGKAVSFFRWTREIGPVSSNKLQFVGHLWGRSSQRPARVRRTSMLDHGITTRICFE